jgi:RNA polymerase sigma-70 factor (ECF subfamily)
MDFIHLRLPLPDGKEIALDDLYRTYRRQLVFFANKYVDDTLQAEDIVSESFIKLWDKKDQFDAEGNIKAFLFTITRNACLDFLKGRQRKTPHIKEYAYIAEKTEQGPDLSMETTIVQLALLERLPEELNRLSGIKKEVIRLCFLENKSLKEIAKMLSFTPQHIGDQRIAAIKQLKSGFNEFLMANKMLSALIIFALSMCLFISMNAASTLFKKIIELFCF